MNGCPVGHQNIGLLESSSLESEGSVTNCLMIISKRVPLPTGGSPARHLEDVYAGNTGAEGNREPGPLLKSFLSPHIVITLTIYQISDCL